jgi:nicotinamide mononucleotide transporter
MLTFIQTHWQEIAGTLLGFLYLYYELKAHKGMFPTGILMSLFFMVVFFDAKFYALASINIYFVFAQAYAWWKWYSNPDQADAPLVHAPSKIWIPICVTTVILFGALWWLLVQVPNEISTVAWGDSLVTTLSMLAVWMLAQHYVEQWLPLIVANAFSVYLFYSQGLYPTTILYFVYLVASFIGYVKWKKMAKRRIING